MVFKINLQPYTVSSRCLVVLCKILQSTYLRQSIQRISHRINPLKTTFNVNNT